MNQVRPAAFTGVSANYKAFQFIEGRPSHLPESQESNKENGTAASPVKVLIESPSKRSTQDHRGEKSPLKPPPSTPATRLPLADLIGNADDTSHFGPSTRFSPEEYILWRPLRSPSSEKRTPAPTRKRRARSSSPPSSSQLRHDTRLVLGASPHDAPPSKRFLRTIQMDPAAELWNRYAISSARDGVHDGPAPSFAKIIAASSPHTVDQQSGNVSGLRRWTSCGIEWPTSKAKRRKVRSTTIKEQVDDLLGSAAQPAPVDVIDEAKKTRIGSLIERIQESLVKAIDNGADKGPSSSSPLPERCETFDRQPLSPPHAHNTLSDSPSRKPQHADNKRHEAIKYSVTPEKIDDMSASSFGSGDLDLTVFDVAGRNDPTAVCDSATSAPEAEWMPEEKGYNGRDSATFTLPLNGENHHDSSADDEEFGEDGGISLADFETVASLYDGTAMCSAEKGGAKAIRVALVEPIYEPPSGSPADEFGDDGIDEESFAVAEAAATQSYKASGPQESSSDPIARAIQRYLVTNVYEDQYTARNGQKLPEKVLLVDDGRTKLHKAITLRQSWFDTRCTKGSYVHVIGAFSKTGQCLIDDTQNMLILHPDHLISALVVADSFGCIRRAVLQDRVKATSDPSPPQTYGTMLHEIFQEAIKVNQWDGETLQRIIAMIVTRHIEDLYQVRLSVEQAADYLQSKMAELQAWAEVFVKAKPVPKGVVKDRNGKQVTMSVNKLLDVEEHIWSPMYGLKGNIDATVQIVMQDEEGERVLTVPFEIKTGKNSTNASHRAQTALYTLLLGDRYDIGVAYGILYYLETSEMSRIPAIRHELRHMVMQRNELACYVRERLSLPPMLKSPHMCNHCYAKTPCFIYHKLVEDGNGETSGMKEKFDEVIHHLKLPHQEFFKKWDDLLMKEESEMMKFRRELWTMLSTEREKLGRCFANVTLEPGTVSEEQGTSKINRFQYTFRKHDEVGGLSFNESHILVGEPIVISDEMGHYALAKGYVTSLQKRHISVAVDRRLHNSRIRQPGFDADVNQVFAGIMEVEEFPNKSLRRDPAEDGVPVLYRLDKDEFSNGLATVRNNLIQIMTDDVFHARELRNLIVDKVEPRFKPTSTAYTLSGPQSQMNVNGDQRAAIEKIMNAEDYALVLGMPGTGKTTTIAHIIRALVSKGKSVLLASYTHTAVDNILLKIRDANIGILRLGAISKIHPEVREFAMLAAEPKTSIEDLRKAYQEPQVVATTCLGINHPLFNERIFDYCIVDEASQITLPVCLGPIRMAKAFVLVGDHYQLPPLVQNREAQEGGLDVSLFKLLCERHPSAVVTLQHQYRMNSEIMSLSNSLIYGGRLKCGSEAIANRRLDLPNIDAMAQFHDQKSDAQPDTSRCPSPSSLNCWLNLTLGPSSPPVIFLNTDPLLPTSLEKANGARITNPTEARLLTNLVRAILATGQPASTIGIITLYRSQLALIKSLLPPGATDQLEAHTADRFQGRDKDIVLLSCVRSNERDAVGELLRDWRRVNVAVTRAKRKLVIVGSAGTLSRGDELLGRLFKMCEVQGWVVDLPPGAAGEEEHVWGGTWSSQAVGRTAGCADVQRTAQRLEGKVLETERAKEKEKERQQPSPRPTPLQPRSANGAGVNKAFKVPSKVGKVTPRAVFGNGSGRGNVKARRPVLVDLVNDIVGEEGFEFD